MWHYHKSSKHASPPATPPAHSNFLSPTPTYTELSTTTPVTSLHIQSHTQHASHCNPAAHMQAPPLPNDFVTSPDFHDCRVIFGHDLPKLVRSTAWSEKLGIAGCPIETLPMLAVTRHSWASYWLRNVCHGLETYPVYTRSVPQAMFISEILSGITHHRLDIDRIAMAHCQCAIPPIPHPTRKQAISALADEFYEYMSGLIRERTCSHKSSSTDQTIRNTSTVYPTNKTTGTSITSPDPHPHAQHPSTTRTSNSVQPKFTSTPFNPTSHNHCTR